MATSGSGIFTGLPWTRTLSSGVDPRGQFAQAMAVDRDGAFEDQLLARAPRTETGPGKILVQTHEIHLSLK